MVRVLEVGVLIEAFRRLKYICRVHTYMEYFDRYRVLFGDATSVVGVSDRYLAAYVLYHQ